MDKPYKIMNVEENESTITITYMSNYDPIPYSLFQCTYEKDDNHYIVNQLLHYCIKSEDFLDIKGLYSSSFEQSLVHSLQQELTNQMDIS